MITKPTVLVLGAGASIPYGYPSGAGLVKEILRNIERKAWSPIYEEFKIEETEVDDFKTELHQSQKPSIDAFLEHRSEFIKVGKIAIALALLSKENPDVLLDFDIRDQGIYHFLYNSLTTSWEEFEQNKLTIVTFNYDRSIEHFLFSALKHSYHKSDVEIAEAIQSIPIIHVHGSLGPLPWQASEGIDYYPLFRGDQGASEILKRIKVASENIIIVSEAQSQSQEFNHAFEYIKEAERVYFLGFGYHRVNLERLGMSRLKNFDRILGNKIQVTSYHSYTDHNNVEHIIEVPRDITYKHCRGSALGLGTAQRHSIESDWRIGLPDNKCNALEFIKEYVDLS